MTPTPFPPGSEAEKYFRRWNMPVEHYSNDGERWITIGGQKADDGKRKGGRPVLIDKDGVIVGGSVPKQTHGKPVGEFGKHVKGGDAPAKAEPPKPQKVTLSGKTYEFAEKLKRAEFVYDPKTKSWSRDEPLPTDESKMTGAEWALFGAIKRGEIKSTQHPPQSDDAPAAKAPAKPAPPAPAKEQPVARKPAPAAPQIDRSEDDDIGIEGVSELRAAFDEEESMQERMERGMASGILPGKPRFDVQALSQKYPRAAAYLKAEGFLSASHDRKSDAGKRAIKALEGGASVEQAEAILRDWNKGANPWT